MTDEAMKWLKDNSGSNYPAFTWPTVGTTVKGKIISTPKPVNTTDMNTGAATTTLVIEMETEDGNVGTLWVKPGSMTSALLKAVTEAGVDGLAEGGTLAVAYVSDGEQKKAGFNKPKIYEAAYAPPAPATVQVSNLLK